MTTRHISNGSIFVSVQPSSTSTYRVRYTDHIWQVGIRARFMFTVLDKQFEYHFKSYSHHRARFAKISSSSLISSCSITELGYDWFSRARYWVLLLSCSLWGFLSLARFDIELALGTELGLLLSSRP